MVVARVARLASEALARSRCLGKIASTSSHSWFLTVRDGHRPLPFDAECGASCPQREIPHSEMRLGVIPVFKLSRTPAPKGRGGSEGDGSGHGRREADRFESRLLMREAVLVPLASSPEPMLGHPVVECLTDRMRK